MILRRIIKKLIKVSTGCTILYKTNWYKSLFIDVDHQIYPSNYWYREHDERNFDLINLGSSGGKWAFNYSGMGIKGMNWAQQPQTLLADYNLLRNFHSILRQDGYVLITIMPFTSLNKETEIMDTMKYLKINSHSPIQPEYLKKARLYEEFPIIMLKPALKALVKYVFGLENKTKKLIEELDINPMNKEMLEKDAIMWIDGWKKQFNITDLDAPLTAFNQEGRKFRIMLMRKLIDFCLERKYKPIYIIPPVTQYLSVYFTESFKNTYIYSFLKDVNREVLLLDYSLNVELTDETLYFNSFFMNKRGASRFTERVLKDLGMIK